MAPLEAADILLSIGLSPDRVLVPSDPDFVERQSSYWSCTVRSVQPACIVQPQSAEEVSSVLRALVSRQVSFAVRSGGHTAWVGANTIGAGGVTIDLGRLNHVRVSNDPEGSETTVDLGPGNRWGKVYTELAKHGLTVAGGREGNVGVAGLILGGGMAFFTARHGLACDNVVEYEVVLADGNIVKARQDGKHADLYQALRGGGNNFGIVTNFKMRSIAARPVWAGMTVHPKETTPQAIQALKDYTDAVPTDVDSNLLCFFTYTGMLLPHIAQFWLPDFKDIKVVGALIHMAGTENAPSYQKWLDMPLTATTCKITTVPQLAMDYSQAKDYHNVWFTATFKNDTRIVAEAAELHVRLVADLKSFILDGDFVTQCLFQPFPRLFGERSAAAGGNMLGIDRQPGNGLLWLAVAQVRTSEQERFVYSKIKEWVQAVREFAASIDGNLEWTYLNYADKSQDPLGSYGVENVRIMREVARKYDPDGVFQTLCPGGFKISKVRLPN